MNEPRRELHRDLTPDERRELFAQGISLFNAGEHFAAHEAFEEIWRSQRSAPRDLFQGLAQLAAAAHHAAVRGRRDVARRVAAKATARLLPLTPSACGLDLAALLAALLDWDAALADVNAPLPPAPALLVADPAAFG